VSVFKVYFSAKVCLLKYNGACFKSSRTWRLVNWQICTLTSSCEHYTAL